MKEIGRWLDRCKDLPRTVTALYNDRCDPRTVDLGEMITRRADEGIELHTRGELSDVTFQAGRAGDLPGMTSKREHPARLFPQEVTHVRDPNCLGADPGSSRR
jgi:hypothetical protein